jgi:hypothetical protein
LGANAFLTKPSEANKLEEMVTAIKDFWLTHNTLPQQSHEEPAAPGVAHARTRTFAAKPSPTMNSASRTKRLYTLANL